MSNLGQLDTNTPENDRRQATVTIANGSTASSVLTVSGSVPVAVFMPAAITGSAFKFDVSLDNSTFQRLTDSSGSDVTVTVAASKAVAFSAAIIDALLAWPYVKLVSGSTELADRSIIVLTRLDIAGL